MATITARGDYQFQAIIRRKGFPSQTKTFETRSEAERWAREVESKMDTGYFSDRREAEKTTLAQALQKYLDQVTCTKKGATAERNRIKQLQRHPIALRSLASLRAKDFTQYRDERLEEVSANTVRLELALLSHLYTIAIKEWSMPLVHELRNVRKPQAGPARERRLESGEETRLRTALRRPEDRGAGVWVEACIDLAIETGMRAGEILTLDWKQVNIEVGTLRLTKTKNGCGRTVPLTDKAVAVLKKLPRDIGGQVIPNFYDTSGLDRAFKRVCHAAGIEDLRFHDLRHEAASRFAPHMTAPILAKIMGWKTIQMAMRYYVGPAKPQKPRLRGGSGVFYTLRIPEKLKWRILKPERNRAGIRCKPTIFSVPAWIR